MTIRDMHLDFKVKLNKQDSNKNRNLKVPEIDWALNEAQEIFIKVIAQPRYAKQIGFEFNQRTIDDLKTIVVNQVLSSNNCLSATTYGDDSYSVTLPANYFFYISSDIYASKATCPNRKLEAIEVSQGDRVEGSPFDRSNFEWGESNIIFLQDKIRIFTDGTYVINKMCLNYLRKPMYMHNAQDWIGGTYTLPGGTVLAGSQNCELPFQVHGELVDLAVAITLGNINPSYQTAMNKLKLTE